jgi:hypothetical protein
VLITIVRRPLRAQASAVAVATLVLPTPPLPVYKIVRGVTRGIISRATGSPAAEHYS